MKTTHLFLIVLISISISIIAYVGDSRSSEEDAPATVPDNGTTTAPSQQSQDEHPQPLTPSPHLLPLQLIAPPTAEAGIPLVGVSVNLLNPGDAAPDASLRLIIHEKDHRHYGDRNELSPDTIKVEVLEEGSWKPVLLRMVNEAVMGAIGTEGVTTHRELYKHGGFAIPAGLNKTWPLRVTFSLPGTYSLIVAVSPDNGSTHLAQPAHSIIVVQ